MGKIIAYGIIFVFVGLVAMFLFSLFFSLIGIVFIAGLVGVVIVAIVVTTITLIGMFKDDENEDFKKRRMSESSVEKHIKDMVEKELQSIKQSDEARRDDRGR
ncbi:MAG: hypothetical protein OXD46_06360 [Chloroflexi bacterium]|nr:hypothetical protein [Chloroflexota bacterium]